MLHVCFFSSFVVLSGEFKENEKVNAECQCEDIVIFGNMIFNFKKHTSFRCCLFSLRPLVALAYTFNSRELQEVLRTNIWY